MVDDSEWLPPRLVHSAIVDGRPVLGNAGVVAVRTEPAAALAEAVKGRGL